MVVCTVCDHVIGYAGVGWQRDAVMFYDTTEGRY